MQLDLHEKKQMRGVDDIEHQVLVIDDAGQHKPSQNESVEGISAQADPSFSYHAQNQLIGLEPNQNEFYGKKASRSPSSEVKVLIVEDNTFSCLALSMQLQQFNIECDKAFNGTQAIQLVKNMWYESQQTYSLIFMDLYLPELNGVQATQSIRDFLSEQANIYKNKSIARPHICLVSSSDKFTIKKYAANADFDSC